MRAVGLDPATDWLPIAPAAHYQCGGIVTDLDGATSLPGLWAAGEVACTGIHGANRLASNSLLEGMVFGPRVIEAIDRGDSEAKPTGAMRAVIDDGVPDLIAGRTIDVSFTGVGLDGCISTRRSRALAARDDDRGGRAPRASSLAETALVVDEVMGLDRGVVDVGAAETHNLATVAHGILTAATVREESRGAHAAPTSRSSTTRSACGSCCDDRRAALGDPRRGRTGARRGSRAARRHHRGAPRLPTSSDTRRSCPAGAGVIAGTASATEAFRQVDTSVVVQWRVVDGDRVAAGDVIGTVEGPLAPILTAERTALNFLCHLSGIATITRRFVDAAAEAPGSRARIWDTRKTLPGLRALEKAAVRSGGGVNHRGSLSRDGAREGQPPRAARHHRGGAARPASDGQDAASKSSANGSSR